MGESKIIVVANQKGGVGKSTLSMLLASYLINIEKMPIGGIIDVDYQQSIRKKREEDISQLRGSEDASSIPDPYTVKAFSLDNYDMVPEFVRRLRSLDDIFIIDTPGTLDSKGLINFLALADYILCPFDYDKLTLQSTTEFLMFCNGLKEKLKLETEYEIQSRIILIPNGKPVNVGTKQERTLWNELAISFHEIGYFIAPEIPESSSLRRCNTIEITEEQLRVSKDTLEYISATIFNN